MSLRSALALGLLALLAACSDPHDDGEIDVSVIGERPRLVDPDRTLLTATEAMLTNATASGLVSLDANGQVEPALAESWIVTDDGLSTIFRIRQAQWSDGSDVTGEDVARSLNRIIAPESRNPLKPLLTSVDAFIGMTGRVVEVRLKVPRPNLLQLLAQPEAAIRREGRGVGPFKIATIRANRLRLVPVAREDEPDDARPDAVMLRYERTALAIARFKADGNDLVTGGTLADWPYVPPAQLRSGRVRFDAGQGLFGLEITGKSPFLSTSAIRNALSMAVDRNAMAIALDLQGWTTSNTILPSQLDSSTAPARPDWAGSTLTQRRADAAARIAEWRARNGTPPVLEVALPSGPGMRILFARLRADWRRIGVQAMAVPLRTPRADMRLVDAVAPNISANWYLTRLSCASGLVCDGTGDRALIASRGAATLQARSAQIAQADSDLTLRASYIPLGAPVRWMLVDPVLSGWKENTMGVHPLNALRPPRAAAP